MEISLHKLYLYDDVRRLLMVDDKIQCLDKDNAPMMKREMKVHKGVDNHLKFRVFTPDGTPLKLFDNIHGRLVSCTSKEVALEKKCRLGSATGMVFLDINEGDIKNASPGLYELVMVKSKEFVSGISDEYMFEPLYTDYSGNIVSTVLITDQGQRDPIPSVEILPEDWIHSTVISAPIHMSCGPLPAQIHAGSKQSGLPTLYGWSNAIPGGRVRNHINGSHTFSVYAENFTGTLEIYGTLDETPSVNMESNSWFRINPSSLSEYVQFIKYTGTEVFFFSGNFMWLRFKKTPDQSTIDNGDILKVLIR